MRVLHLASFNGNIGDNAHHNGFRNQFEKVFGPSQWHELEIRNFYRSWNKLKFDRSFSAKANEFDFLVIGGGNFFEVCHDYSRTGCTIDLPSEVIDQIKVPIFFNALGFDTKKGASKSNLSKFKVFMEDLLDRDNVFVTFRNDGSVENYIDSYGVLDTGIEKIPDGGFFIHLNETCEVEERVIGLNLACDMIGSRLKDKTYEQFLHEISSVFQTLASRGYKLRLFPHIISDLKIIYDFCATLPDYFVKYNLEVMPYFTGQGREKEFFARYRECAVVTGMRFHTNVCAFGMGKPTVPLMSYPKIGDLYQDIGQSDWIVDVNSENFPDRYLTKIEEAIDTPPQTLDVLKDLELQQRAVLERMKNKLFGDHV